MTSIIILSYNTKDILSICLDSIRLHTDPGTYELIVVDNASKDGSVEYLKQQSDVRVIYNSENVGFPKGCNQGLSIARGEELLLLNSDTIVTPRWLEQLRHCLYASPKTGAVSCVTNSCSNLQQIEVPYELPDLEGLFAFAESFNQQDSSRWERRMKLIMFCYIFKREIYERLGGLDERFTPGNYEDDDYSFRIWQTGYECILAKDTFIHHINHASFKKTDSDSRASARKFNELLTRNKKKFMDKWGVTENFAAIGDAAYCFGEYLQAGDRVLLFDVHTGFALLHLEQLKKDLRLMGICSNKAEYELAKLTGFDVQYCSNLGRDIWRVLPHELDAIIAGNDIALDEGAVKSLLEYVRPGGRVCYRVKQGDEYSVVYNTK